MTSHIARDLLDRLHNGTTNDNNSSSSSLDEDRDDEDDDRVNGQKTKSFVLFIYFS